MLDFCPQDLGAKEKGRATQCKASGLSYKEVAPYFSEATPGNFQRQYNAFIEAFPEQAKLISNMRPAGIGPGEMLAWFLFDNITVGGANATCDLSIDAQDFAEMKAGRYCKRDHSLDDFKLSRDHDPSVKFIVNALSVSSQPIVTIDCNEVARDEHGNILPHFATPLFLRQVTDILHKKRQTAVDTTYRTKIIESWKDQIFPEYIDGKRIALIQTGDLRMRYLGELTKDMVGLYRIHRNQPWARVYLPKQSLTEVKYG